MINTNLLPKRSYLYEVVHENGSTSDIVKEVLRADSEMGNEMCAFSKQFADGEKGLIRLFNFVRDGIKYEIDPNGIQAIKSPSSLYDIGRGDCKSKTLFINSVLYCLKIPYIIRFTNYNKREKEVKHVYTVAIINGKELPLDTVYKIYGKEKRYELKKDYKPMTKIIRISGCDEMTPYTPNVKTNEANKLQDVIFTTIDQSKKRLEEIKQKQRYVPEAENIQFNKVSEGVASLKIAKRELEILAIMKPQLKNVCIKGIELINNFVEKGNYTITGDIPKELNNLCARINYAKNLVMPANAYGLKAKKINHLRAELNEDGTNKIGAFPERLCLESLWFMDNGLIQNSGYVNYAPSPPMDANFGFCQNAITQVQNYYVTNMNTVPPTTSTTLKYKDVIFLWYGRNSKYRESFANGSVSFNQKLSSLASQNNPPVFGLQGMSGWFNNQVGYDLTLEELAQNSSVLSNYLNDIYRTNPNGSMGSALFYDFRTGVMESGQPVNPNLFPASVIAKGVAQGGFIDSCTSFTGVSNSNIKGLARNGILYDNGGEQPEQTLSTLLRLYNTNTSVSGIGDFGISAAIIAAIAAALVAVIGAIGSAIAESNKAKQQASLIDQSAADTARLSAIGNNSTPNESDWTPLTQRRDTENSSGGTGLAIAGAALLAYLATKDDKK